MKLLIVGHSYAIAGAQDKFVTMKQLDSSLQIRLLTWRKSNYLSMDWEREIHPALTNEEVVSIRDMFSKSHMTYILDPVLLTRLFRRFRPDHIHIEEDPHSFVGVETVLLARLFCREATISFFIWDNLWRQPFFPLNMLKKAFTKFSLSRCSLVICGNTEAGQLLSKKGYHGRRQNLPQVGFNQEEYVTAARSELRQQFIAGQEGVLIGFLGRLVPEKGVILLLKALVGLRHLPWKLLICGAGPLEKEIREDWQSFYGPRLILRRSIPRTEVAEYLKCLDIFVLPSYEINSWKEQFGMTLAQAMMAGVACIGSSSGSIPEVLGPGGLIFNEGNVESFVAALERLLSSKSERETYGRKGRQFATQHYTSRKVSAAYLEAFSNLLDNKGGYA